MSFTSLKTALKFFLSHYHLKLFTQSESQSILSIYLKCMLHLSYCILKSSSVTKAMMSIKAVTKQSFSSISLSTLSSSSISCLLEQIINSEHF